MRNFIENVLSKKKVRRLKRVSVISAVTPAIPATLTAHISALRTPRNIRTRGVTIAEHDPEIEKTARIAGILRELCEDLTNYKGMRVLLQKKKKKQ